MKITQAMFKIAVQSESGNFGENWKSCIISSGNECLVLDMRTEKGFTKALTCDGIMWHIDMWPSIQAAASSILPVLEFSAGKKVFPNYSTRWHFDNKVSQSYLLKEMGVNTPKTKVFWNEKEAIEWVHSNSSFPLIAKFKRGAASLCVFHLRNEHEAVKYIYGMFSANGLKNCTGAVRQSSYVKIRNIYHCIIRLLPRVLMQQFLTKRPRLLEQWHNERGYVYFQEYLPDNNGDTRITVIGDRAFAFHRVNRVNDFRASGSGSLEYDMSSIDMSMISAAHRISRICGFQSMAYDFLYDKNGQPSLIEISFGFQSAAVYNCPGYWDRNMKWHDGHILPEVAHVQDMLAEINR